jgi:hypothetical protein
MSKVEKEIEEARKIPYEEMLAKHPEFAGVISKKNWEHIGHSDKMTVGWLSKMWEQNARDNFDNKLWKKHGPLRRDCFGLGRNKAVVGIGAGASLKKNLHILKRIVLEDGRKDWKDRDFVFIASNHMFKPLLKEGIIPDFVILADASDVVKPQLLEDIPSSGQNTILIAGVHCSPKILKKWAKQGRAIRFYISASGEMERTVREHYKIDPKPYMALQGGNVINSAWSMGMMVLRSTVFMALGNDLSFPVDDDVEKRRNGYYADGDYSANIANKRDEAKSTKRWMGFELERTHIITSDVNKRYHIKVKQVGTTSSLWVYKTWLEANCIGSAFKHIPYHYYNCSEGGIAGVMCKDDSDEGLNDESNWFMLDDVCPRYHTRMFEDAISEFLRAKEAIKWGIHAVAPSAIISARAA